MEAINEIPADVLAIIEQKEISLQEERECEEKAKRLREMETLENGRRLYSIWVTKSLSLVPEWLERYLRMTEDREPNFERIARGWDRLESNYLFFSIPGLSEIQFNPNNGSWRAAPSFEGYFFENEFHEPYFSFRDTYWKEDLESALVAAKHQYADYQNYQVDISQKKTEYETLCAERAERARKELDERDQLTNVREIQAQKERSEEDALLDVVRQDPVALHMLKALILIHEERSSFVQRIQDAEETAFWADEHITRVRSQMRHQIDRAQRQADDEKARLQNDLDDAEAKLKKAE